MKKCVESIGHTTNAEPVSNVLETLLHIFIDIWIKSIRFDARPSTYHQLSSVVVVIVSSLILFKIQFRVFVLPITALFR